MQTDITFLLVDDDDLSTLITKTAIKRSGIDAAVVGFTDPEEGLHYLQSVQSTDTSLLIVLLDINMPFMDGWEFLDEFEKLEKQKKKSMQVYMLSSSINARDMDRALQNRNVIDYIQKPIGKANLVAMLSKIHANN